MEHTIIFQPSGRRGKVPEGTTILDAARRLGVGIEAVCGEQLVCGKCRVKVMEGSFPKEGITSHMDHLSELDEKEIKVLKRKDSVRLAAVALFTCFLVGFTILTYFATVHRGPNWHFYWWPSQWPVH